MSKRLSAIDRAILNLMQERDTLDLAIRKLEAQRATETRKKQTVVRKALTVKESA